MNFLQNESRFRFEDYREIYAGQWDRFMESNGLFSFQFTRLFLDNFADEFIDRSILIFDEFNELRAIFPIVLDEKNRKLTSHANSSYGGIVFCKSMNMFKKREVYCQVLTHLFNSNPVESIEIRIPPGFLNGNFSGEESYILWSLHGHPRSLFLHSVVNLCENGSIDWSKVKRRLHSRVEMHRQHNLHELRPVWDLIDTTLRKRHNTKPVHNFEQLTKIVHFFPKHVRVYTARMDEVVLGALVFFNTSTSFHLQYMAVSDEGRSLSVGDGLITNSLEDAKTENYHYFDFGHSSLNDGYGLNDGLFLFKTKFGTSSQVAMKWTISRLDFFN